MVSRFSHANQHFLYTTLVEKTGIYKKTKEKTLRQPLAAEFESTTLVMIELFTYYNEKY